MNKISLLCFGFFSLSLASFAGESKIIFEENKNQWPSQVKYQADIPGGKLFLENNTFTYLYRENIDWHSKHRNESASTIKVKYHSYKVNFENANRAVVVLGNNRHSSHRNYYLGNDPKKWADNVALFGQVYYKDLYSNIDMQVYNTESNLKYDIIVHSGGNPKDIKLNYTGTDGMRIENGHLFIKTSVCDLIEQKPYTYQEINGVKKEITCSYVLDKNAVSFSVGKYDPAFPLIIDPTTLIASTYSGSLADNWGFTATYDDAGNIYMGGTIWGVGYPTTVGAHDASFNAGNFDILLNKFNPQGTQLLFATYYGGSGDEQPASMIVNSSNELYVAGRTNSTNFPTVGGSVNNGSYDIIVGKFSSSGGLLGSVYIGGSGDDGVNVDVNWNTYGTTKFNYADDTRCEITLDAASNVYVTTSTRSVNFPTTAGVYDATSNSTQDAVVFKMNSSLTALTWSTYLGGAGDDAAYGLRLDNSNNVYVTGGTTSNNFPTTPGVLHQTYNGGLTDGFISVLNSTGTSLLRSTFLGTSAYDQSFFIDVDQSGDVYVFGQTQGTYSVTVGSSNSGQFIHKLSGNLTSTVFSTTIGNGNNAVNISPTAFEIDSCGTIHFAGWGRSSLMSANMPFPSSTSGLPVTANAFQSITDGKDFYIATLLPGAAGLFYATFFGEGGSNPLADHLDGGTCRFDKNGILYHAGCASCQGTNGFPVIPGAYSSTNNSFSGARCNEVVFKMAVATNPIAKINAVSGLNGCTPFTACFNNTGSNANNFIWDFGDGGTSTLPSPCYTYSVAGSYTVTLFAIDSIGICGYLDTAMLTINVGSVPTLSVTVTNASSCSISDGKISIVASGGLQPYTYSWSNGNTTTVNTGLAAGNYTLTVTDAVGCTNMTIDTVACLTGTVGLLHQSDFSFYPNPTSGLLYISYPLNTSEISISDVLGRKIFHSYVPTTGRSSIIDLTATPAGVYFIEIEGVNRSTVKKIIRE